MLPEICLDVRASTDGSADPWPSETLREVRAMLDATVKGWEKDRGDKIDAAVHSMCRAAIEIITDELERRARDGSDF